MIPHQKRALEALEAAVRRAMSGHDDVGDPLGDFVREWVPAAPDIDPTKPAPGFTEYRYTSSAGESVSLLRGEVDIPIEDPTRTTVSLDEAIRKSWEIWRSEHPDSADALAERDACIREIEYWSRTAHPHDEVFPDALVASIRAGEHLDPAEDPVPMPREIVRDTFARIEATAERYAETVDEVVTQLAAAIREAPPSELESVLRTFIEAAVPCQSCGADPRVSPASGAELPVVRGALDAPEAAERRAAGWKEAAYAWREAAHRYALPARTQATAKDHAVAIAEEIDTLICARVDEWDDGMRAEAQSKLAEAIRWALAWPVVRACAYDDMLRAMIREHEQRTLDRADLAKALREVADEWAPSQVRTALLDVAGRLEAQGA